MLRSRVSGVLVFLILESGLLADELKGHLKHVDAEKNRLTVVIAAKDLEFVVSDTARILDARGGEIKERLRSKVIHSSSPAKITTLVKEGRAEILTLRLTNDYLERPDEFYLDPAKAGPDFYIQGEYEGEVLGQGKLGAQVVVEDDSLFSIAFFPGGLPGAGWDGKTKTVKAAAATVDAKTTITGSWNGQIIEGKLIGKSADGHSFTLTRVVRKSPTLGAKPPADALVLFDGTNTANFPKAAMSDDGLLKVPATSKQLFQDIHLHAEFLIPYRGPSRGNSGVYMQNCHEIQILDSFGALPSPSGCGGLYVFRPPDVNMTFPPLSWQTYDVDYTAARFDAEGKMVKNPVITVRHNGIVVHDNITLREKGNGGRPSPQGGPLHMQRHGSPVRFGNIWVVEKK